MTGKSTKEKWMCWEGHDKNTPSMVFYEKPYPHFRCFGCGKTFDIFDAARYLEGLNFKEALNKFAIKYGYEDKLYEDQIKPNTVYSIFEDLKNVAMNFEYKYMKKSVKEYLKKKKITVEDMKKYDIGYISNPIRIINQLKKKYGETDIKILGLDQQNLLVDESLIFFIMDKDNKPIAITRRYCGTQNFPKYVNTKNNVLYKKSETLYGMNRINLNKKYVYLVEGQTDALALWKIGHNALAVSGTATNESTIKSIVDLGLQNIIIMFDNDNAGKNATYKFIDFILENSLIEKYNLKVLVKQLDEELDIDEYINKYSADKFNQIKPISVIEFLTQYLLSTESAYDAVEKIGNLFAKYNNFNLLKTIDIIYNTLSKNKSINKLNLYNYLENRIIQSKLISVNEYMINIKQYLDKLQKDYDYLLERHLFNNTDVGQVFEE
jgi:DNA primase